MPLIEILIVSPIPSNKRGDKNRFEDMELSFHKKVKDGFEYMLSKENERFIRIDVTNITINELNNHPAEHINPLKQKMNRQ